MIEPVQYSTPLQPLYPKWFDENATYAYHSEAKGHNIENCMRLKEVVQGIINEGQLTFDTDVSRNVGANLFPNHGRNEVNAINVELAVLEYGESSNNETWVKQLALRIQLNNLDTFEAPIMLADFDKLWQSWALALSYTSAQ